MDHHPYTTTPTTTQTQTEAERLLTISSKLLTSRDLTGSREFALLAQETEPLLEGSDQIIAITDVLIASEKRVNNNRHHHDWYSILQSEPRSDPGVLKTNYRRLALLLHPDKNNYPLADSAFKLVADAWAVLSDPSKRTSYDQELSLFSKETYSDKDKLPVRRSSRGGGEAGEEDYNHNAPSSTTMPPRQAAHHSRGGQGAGERDESRMSNFWTACPYCYVLYEYPRVYKECCMRCQNCERAFHAVAIPSLPPMVPGKEGYYCCWGFFPLGFSGESGGKGKNIGSTNNNPDTGFPNWMPNMFTTPIAATPLRQQRNGVNVDMNTNIMGNANMNAGVSGVVDFSNGSASGGYRNAIPRTSAPGSKKRGRPRKNPLAV